MDISSHVLSKPSKHQKGVEIETLIDDVQQLAKQKKVMVEPTFQAEMVAEASKTRGSYTSKVLEKRHVEASKQLREDPSITIRRADKTAAFVLIDTEDYLNKLDDLLNDTTKFRQITRNPVDELKKKINSVIVAVNAESGSVKFSKLSGDYGLGYCYGNIKTHKPGNKLRTIISQIPTPSYGLSKKLCELLTPYIPSIYSLKSAGDFLEILASSPAEGIIASRDAESFFF